MQLQLSHLPWPCALCGESGHLHETNALWRELFGERRELEACVPTATAALQSVAARDDANDDANSNIFEIAFETTLKATLAARDLGVNADETSVDNEAPNAGRMWPVTLRFSRLTGQRIWLVALSEPSDEASQSALVTMARAVSDVEHQLDREQDGVAMRLQARHWKAFFRDAAAGKALIGLRGETLEVNPALCALMGCGEDELSAIHARDMRHPDDRARIEAHYDDLLAGGLPVAGIEGRYRHARGHYLTCLLALSLIRDSRERPLYFAAEVEDITSRCAAEASLREQTLQLERANAELERSNAELERFAFVASHDLQEPLRKIRVFSDRLQPLIEQLDGADAAQGTRFLEAMMRGAARMQNLIDDLLEYARLKERAQPFGRVDLNILWRELLEDFETIIRESAARVEIETLPVVMGDRTRLRQLFANLLSNALKFRGEAAPVVRVEVWTETAQAGQVAVAVSDNGIGFEAEYAQTIFEVFTRLHGRATYPGTGIGLAICRRIAREHGGEVRASAALGQGARFVVTLMAAEKAETA